MERRTRTVATLGPATDRPGVLERLLHAGLDVARINFSHGAAEEHLGRIERLRECARAAGRAVAVLADLPGPKLRALIDAPLELQTGRHVTLALRAGVSADIHLTEPEVADRMRPGQRVLLDDGRLLLRVSACAQDCATLTVEAGGTLLPNKGFNLPDTELHIAAVTRRDREAIAVAARAGVDWLALSFVRDAAAAHELHGVTGGYGLDVPVLAKIERPEAVTKAAQIVKAFDGIMVARGDLGVEIALERVPHVQKRLINLARAAGKPVVTATDMLDSMRHSPRPTRAEVSDVANAVYDGTDAVMLSGETAVGDHPVESLECMNAILIEAEKHLVEAGPRDLNVPKGDLTDHITHLTCALAHDIKADAIVAPTITGRTARLVARHRPRAAIVAVASSDAVVRELGIVWGVRSVSIPFPVRAGDDRVEAAVRAAYLGGAVAPGTLVVVLAGHPVEGGAGYPTIRVVRVGNDGHACEP